MVIDRGRPLRKMATVLFLIYILLVPVWVLLFKSSCEIFYIGKWNGRVIASEEMIRNFTHYANINPRRIFWGDMLLNILAFVPFGIYLEMLYHEKKAAEKILVMFLVSLAIEVTQFTLIIGATDIVDLIANTLGGIAGLLIMKLLYHNNVIKVILVIAAFITVVVAVEVGIHTVKIYNDVKDFYNEETYTEYLNVFGIGTEGEGKG